MKQFLVIAALLVVAACVQAQSVSNDSLPAETVAAAAAPTVTADSTPLVAAEAAPASPNSSAFSLAATPDPEPASADQRPTVYGVLKTYNWQATAGYTFFRFYIVPHVTRDMNGLNLGLVYYPGGHWIGVDGEFIGAWGASLGCCTTKYVQGMGGPRFRWAVGHGVDLWAHGMAGGANFLPQTVFGSQGAFAWEAGGGADFNVHQKRWAYRVSANVVGTRFFSTYQYSPNVSVGIVFKF